MRGRHALLIVPHSLLIVAALLLLLTALSQPVFIVQYYNWLIQPEPFYTAVMGSDWIGALYFILILSVIGLTAFITTIRLRWGSALRNTPLLAATILLLASLIMYPLIAFPLPPVLSDPPPPSIMLAEGYYTYCLSCILLIAAQALGPPIATLTVSPVDTKKTA